MEDHTLHLNFLVNFDIHLRERVATAWEVEFIFMLKHTLLSVFTKDRCTAVKYSPYIEWRLSAKDQWKQKYVANTNGLVLNEVPSHSPDDSPESPQENVDFESIDHQDGNGGVTEGNGWIANRATLEAPQMEDSAMESELVVDMEDVDAVVTDVWNEEE